MSSLMKGFYVIPTISDTYWYDFFLIGPQYSLYFKSVPISSFVRLSSFIENFGFYQSSLRLLVLLVRSYSLFVACFDDCPIALARARSSQAHCLLSTLSFKFSTLMLVFVPKRIGKNRERLSVSHTPQPLLHKSPGLLNAPLKALFLPSIFTFPPNRTFPLSVPQILNQSPLGGLCGLMFLKCAASNVLKVCSLEFRSFVPVRRSD